MGSVGGSLGQLALYGIGLLAALAAVARTDDQLFAAHAWIVALVCVVAAIITLRRTRFDAPPAREPDRNDTWIDPPPLARPPPG